MNRLNFLERLQKANYYLHFAPASVIHVIETKAFGEVLRLLTAYERSKILSNYPTRTVLQNAFSALYILVDNKESSSSSDEAFNKNKLPRTDSEARAKYSKNMSPFQNSTLIPLAAPALKELLGLYGARRMDSQTTIPDAVTVYREDESDLNLKVIVLVRDPRGMLKSRSLMEWCNTLNKCTDIKSICDNLLDNFLNAIFFKH